MVPVLHSWTMGAPRRRYITINDFRFVVGGLGARRRIIGLMFAGGNNVAWPVILTPT